MSTLKQGLIHSLRRWRLLTSADRALYLARRMAAWPDNRRFRDEHPGFATPPANLFYDVCNDTLWRNYYETGRRHARVFVDLIRERAEWQGPGRILEWGCGPGRVIRHVPDLLASAGELGVEVHGCDVNERSIAWCREQLGDGSGIRFSSNTPDPPLDFDSDSFDAVYGFSVLTHLSAERQLAWSAELMRVLKPGAVLIATTHGEAFKGLMTEAQCRRFDAGEPVVQAGIEEGKKLYLSMHPPAFVRDRLLAGFEEVQRLDGSSFALVPDHDVWFARKARN